MTTRLTVQHQNSMISKVPPLVGAQNKDIMSSPYSLSPTQGDETASTSSLSNTDSDSLRSVPQQPQQVNSSSGSRGTNNNNISRAASKSPILIKYNYYDYNGARQEQTNHDMNYNNNNNNNQQISNSGISNGKIQRHLSPTFKQHLDEIVRNSQQQQQQQLQLQPKNNINNNTPPSPLSPQQQHNDQLMQLHFARRYKLSSYEQRCLRCNKTVYQMDKVGPLKDFTFYHQNCFKCRECGTKLTLKTYFNNQQSSGDQEVYCHRHCPKTGPGKLDNQSVGIRAALNAPKVFDSTQLNGSSSELHHHHHHHSNGQLINGTERLSPSGRHNLEFYGNSTPNVDSRALYIQHAVQQTRLQNIYKQQQQQQMPNKVTDKRLSQLISGRLEYLEPKQKLLEMRHREEEDALFKAFELKWRQEESSISEQIREEWQIELNKLLDKYKRQLSSISSSSQSQPSSTSQTKVNGHSSSAAAVAAVVSKQIVQKSAQQVTQHQHQPIVELNSSKQQVLQKQQQEEEEGAKKKQQMIEFERMNLEKTMTIKLDRKKETLKRKLKEFERQATAELVEKQSREMLALISMKLDEYKEEQKRKIGYDLEQFEAIDSLANQLSVGTKLSSTQTTAAAAAGNGQATSSQLSASSPSANHNNRCIHGVAPVQSGSGQNANITRALNLEIPAPKPPQVCKMELYNSDEPDEVFRDIDQVAINVAREDQQTFTDLVHHLTRHCLTDIEKVRAIFRWITVKNLNTMQFDSSVKPDTPLGLLRGIKNGSESYHVLFKRLCSYAGLHCVVIKGFSKSAGYQPGVKFEGNRFRNSWNAVYVAGAWRFVQCNWGARHLVSVAVMQDKNQPINRNRSHKQQQHQVAVPDATASGQKQRVSRAAHAVPSSAAITSSGGRSHNHHHQQQRIASPNHGRRGLANNATPVPGIPYPPAAAAAQFDATSEADPYNLLPKSHHHHAKQQLVSHNSRPTKTSSPPTLSSSSSSSSSLLSSPNLSAGYASNGSSPSSSPHHQSVPAGGLRQKPATGSGAKTGSSSDSLRYEYDDHYFLTDPDEFIYEFHPLSSEWQLIKTRPITLAEFEQLPFVRSLFFKYGLYFPQQDIRSVLYTDSSGATTIKIGMPTHMVPSLIFHYNLKYYDSDLEHYEGVSLKRFVMQSVECGTSGGDASSNGQTTLLSNIVSFRVHLPENGAYILDIFANSTTPTQYITGEPMKFKSVCKFKIMAKNLKTVMIPLPDCASGEFGPMKATRLFGIIPITHESGLIVVQNDKRFLEIQFRMTRPLLDFMASLHKNGYDERQLSKSIKIFIDGDIVFVTVKFFEDGQYGLDIYTRDVTTTTTTSGQLEHSSSSSTSSSEPKKQLLTHCCKYLINVRTSHNL